MKTLNRKIYIVLFKYFINQCNSVKKPDNLKILSLYPGPLVKLKSGIFSKNFPSEPGSSFKNSLRTTLTRIFLGGSRFLISFRTWTGDRPQEFTVLQLPYTRFGYLCKAVLGSFGIITS